MHREILEVINDEPQQIKTITLPPLNIWQKMLQSLRLKKPKRLSLELRGVKLRSFQKLCLLILDLNNTSEYEGTDSMFDIGQANAFKMAAIIATAIHNDKTPPPEYLIDAILDNFNNAEIRVIVEEVYRRLDMENFFGSMASLRELPVVKDIRETTVNQLLSETSSLPTS